MWIIDITIIVRTSIIAINCLALVATLKTFFRPPDLQAWNLLFTTHPHHFSEFWVRNDETSFIGLIIATSITVVTQAGLVITYAPAKAPMKKLRATVKTNQGAGITSPLQSHACKVPMWTKLINKISKSGLQWFCICIIFRNIFW